MAKGRSGSAHFPIRLAWPRGVDNDGKEDDDTSTTTETIGKDDPYGDTFGPQTTPFVVSAGDGALAVAWEATTTIPTTVGEIDGYVVQHRLLLDAVVDTATDAFEAAAWTDWTSADKTASDRAPTSSPACPTANTRCASRRGAAATTTPPPRTSPGMACSICSRRRLMEALDEGRCVRPAHQFHVAGPRPAHGHHEGPVPEAGPEPVRHGWGVVLPEEFAEGRVACGLTCGGQEAVFSGDLPGVGDAYQGVRPRPKSVCVPWMAIRRTQDLDPLLEMTK